VPAGKTASLSQSRKHKIRPRGPPEGKLPPKDSRNTRRVSVTQKKRKEGRPIPTRKEAAYGGPVRAMWGNGGQKRNPRRARRLRILGWTKKKIRGHVDLPAARYQESENASSKPRITTGHSWAKPRGGTEEDRRDRGTGAAGNKIYSKKQDRQHKSRPAEVSVHLRSSRGTRGCPRSHFPFRGGYCLEALKVGGRILSGETNRETGGSGDRCSRTAANAVIASGTLLVKKRAEGSILRQRREGGCREQGV